MNHVKKTLAHHSTRKGIPKNRINYIKKKNQTKNRLEDLLDQHFVLNEISSDYHFLFKEMNYYEKYDESFIYDEGEDRIFYSTATKHYPELFKLYDFSKPIFLRQDTCFCIDDEPIDDFLLEFEYMIEDDDDWCLYDVFMHLGDWYRPFCQHHSFFEDFKIVETAEKYIITFHYGS